MRQRNLGKTGILVSELGLGTWGLSGDGYGFVSEADQDAVIDRALAVGINLFETADCYARGAMEKRLAARLPSSAIVITKIGTDRDSRPARKRFDEKFLDERLSACSERLGRKALDVVLLHNPSLVAVERGAAARFMERAVEQGRLRAWGISAGEAKVVSGALSMHPRPSLVQMAYNVLYSREVSEISEQLESNGTGLVARSVLGHGLLAGFWGNNRRFAREDHRVQRWTPDQLDRRLKEVHALRHSVSAQVPTLRAVAVRFVLDDALVSSALLGPRSVVQLDQLVREAGKEPPYLGQEKRGQLLARVKDGGAFE